MVFVTFSKMELCHASTVFTEELRTIVNYRFSKSAWQTKKCTFTAEKRSLADIRSELKSGAKASLRSDARGITSKSTKSYSVPLRSIIKLLNHPRVNT